jgi:hypothetical protein
MRHQFAHKIQAFGLQCRRQRIHARGVTAWPIEAGNQPRSDGVLPDVENDGNSRRGSLCCPRRDGPACRGAHGHVLPDQVSRKALESIIVTLSHRYSTITFFPSK